MNYGEIFFKLKEIHNAMPADSLINHYGFCSF
jgi:hypothetical protein